MNADSIINDILRREGGDAYTNRAADKGGPTKFGITAATLGSWRKLAGPASADAVKQLEEAEARDIYYAEYVSPWDFAPDPLRMFLIDWGVTTSHLRVIRALQVALTEAGYYRGAIDGIVGPATRAAIGDAVNDDFGRRLYRMVLAARIRFYVTLGLDASVRKFLSDNPSSQLHNVKGWVNRCLEFL